MEQYDIIIIGGGIVGLAFANLMADSGLSILIVDPKLDHIPPINTADYDLRVSAITRKSQNILRQVKVWDEIVALRACPYHKMQVWDTTGIGNITFEAEQINEPDLGHIIENRIMQYTLQQQASNNPNITTLASKVSQLSAVRQGYQLVIKAPATSPETSLVQTKLLIGADGANSWLRTQLNIDCVNWDYQHLAMVATICTEHPHSKVARQWFYPTGPLALLPLADDNLCSIVWSQPPIQINQLTQLNDAAFAHQLCLATKHLLGKLQLVGPRISYPLKMRHVKHYVLPNLALLGDAAHTVHPLVGQGLNLGLADALALSTLLKQATANKQTFYHDAILQQYETMQKNRNWLMIAGIEFFKQLFGNNITPIRYLRNMGLVATDKMSLIKREIMRYAMGCSW